MWTAADIEIVIDDDLTEDPVLTAEIDTPAGRLKAMAAVTIEDGVLILDGLHMHGEDIGPGEFGMVSLRRLADAVLEALECHEIVVKGAVRRSGANPGRVPPALRFQRRLRA